MNPHEVADRAVPKYAKAILGYNEVVRRSITERRVREAVETGDYGKVEAIPDWAAGQRYLESLLPSMLRDILEDSADVQGKSIAKARFGQAKILDVTDPHVTQWIRQHSGESIREFGNINRSTFRDMLAKAKDMNMSTSHLSRWLKNVGVGLDSRSANAVENYRRRLEEDGTNPKRIDALVRRYSERLERQRAVRIAKTETLTAETQGRLEYLRQEQERGNIGRDALLEWVTSLDERTCQVCSDLDGEAHTVGYLFSGGIVGPPAHPSCRCSLRLTKEFS